MHGRAAVTSGPAQRPVSVPSIVTCFPASRASSEMRVRIRFAVRSSGLLEEERTACLPRRCMLRDRCLPKNLKGGIGTGRVVPRAPSTQGHLPSALAGRLTVFPFILSSPCSGPCHGFLLGDYLKSQDRKVGWQVNGPATSFPLTRAAFEMHRGPPGRLQPRLGGGQAGNLAFPACFSGCPHSGPAPLPDRIFRHVPHVLASLGSPWTHLPSRSSFSV